MPPALGPGLPRVAGENSSQNRALARDLTSCPDRDRVVRPAAKSARASSANAFSRVLGLGESTRPSSSDTSSDAAIRQCDPARRLEGTTAGRRRFRAPESCLKKPSGRPPNKPLQLAIPPQRHRVESRRRFGGGLAAGTARRWPDFSHEQTLAGIFKAYSGRLGRTSCHGSVSVRQSAPRVSAHTGTQAGQTPPDEQARNRVWCRRVDEPG